MKKTVKKSNGVMGGGKRRVVFVMLGSVVDQPSSTWRPTLAMCKLADLHFDRIELMHPGDAPGQELAKRLATEIGCLPKAPEVRRLPIDLPNPWDFAATYSKLEKIAAGYPFQADQEEYYVNISTGTHVVQICLFLLLQQRRFPAVLLKLHAPYVQEKLEGNPYTVTDLRLEKYAKLARATDGASVLNSGIRKARPEYRKMVEEITKVARTTSDPILLIGPTGSGKSRLARELHKLRWPAEPGKEMIVANCATLGGDTVRSTLFGHKKGAFTGAVADHPGLLKEADNSTLFLDEIGELPLDVQAALLRSLDEKAFRPIGGVKEETSDFRLICATNRDLHAEVAAGRFREDLLARIQVWTFQLPGLRDRPKEDFDKILQAEVELLAMAPRNQSATFDPAGRKQFLDFACSPEALWLANFRDLKGAVIRMVTLAENGQITCAVVQNEIERLKSSWSSQRMKKPAGTESDAGLEGLVGSRQLAAMDRFDRDQLANVIQVCRHARTLAEAGKILYAVSLSQQENPNPTDRLSKYLKRFGIDWNAIGRI